MNWHFLKNIKNSFRIKVILASILFMLLTCFSLTVFFIHHQSATLTEALYERGNLLMGMLAHSARVGVFAENKDLLKNPVDGVLEQREVDRVFIYGANGSLLYAAGADLKQAAGAKDPSPSGLIGEKLAERLRSAEASVYFDVSGGLQVWSAVFSRPVYESTDSLFFKEGHVPNPRRVIGFINIELSKKTLDLQVYGFLLKTVLIALVATIAGSVLIYLVINSIASPLNRLAAGIKALGTNGMVAPVPVGTEDEIGRLAAAFNELSESLRKRNEENFQLEKQLRQAQKLEALGTLAGGIAHDFNNVLSPIFGYTEMSMDQLQKNDPLYHNLKQVLSAAGRARDLVKQILAFSRQSQKEKMPLRIQIVVKEALKLLRASLPATIEIKEQIDSVCGPVLADPTDIHRIVMNLGTNAYHAMREKGGRLEVVVEEKELTETGVKRLSLNMSPGRYVKISVRDTGIGINEETLQRIFDPYFTTKPSGEGTGMGLSMVHGIVKASGGEILVDSKVGSGTCFKVYLPRIEELAGSVEPVSAESIPGGRERVLLVDDEADIANMLKQMLENLGYRVTVRTSSLEALEVFAADPGQFDLIVTDQTMPNMTGDELAAQVILMRRDIPIILCTGFSEVITEKQAREKGIHGFLMKPILRRKMALTIREVMEGRARDLSF